ncbi:ATP-binding cassette domain-containing protein [Polaromonas sp. P1(28)-13]|nr:ATP-binding cassette domain-containing protein [Polaromonas sp. P1(28)-13]
MDATVTTAAPGTTALRVEKLGVRYGALVALDGMEWEVRPGELLGIIGPNGAGKSSCYDAVTAMVTRQGKVLLAEPATSPTYLLTSWRSWASNGRSSKTHSSTT